ncbi:MAG: transcription elongation factor GreA [Bacteroidota bacterium]
MATYNYLTKEGHDRLQAELDDLKSRGRQEAAAAIAEAREKGDLSENAEYDAAKDAQGLLELKINELEKALANARVLDASTMDTSEVRLLTSVKIKNKKRNKEMVYTIVSESEADLKAKKLSVSSPIGSGLLGKKVGDVAKIQTPAGLMEFEILDIFIA